MDQHKNYRERDGGDKINIAGYMITVMEHHNVMNVTMNIQVSTEKMIPLLIF